MDVADLLQSAHTLNGLGLLSSFAESLFQHIPRRASARGRVLCFLLELTSDCVSENIQADSVLGEIFTAPAIRASQPSPWTDSLASTPDGGRPRLNDTLTTSSDMPSTFLAHSEFSSTRLDDPVLGGPLPALFPSSAPRVVLGLPGRPVLFIEHYQTIYAGPVIDAFAEERIVHAIACHHTGGTG